MSDTAVAAPERSLETVEVSREFLDSIVEKTVKAGISQYALIPKSFEEAEKYADFIAKSQCCPKGMNKSDVFLVIQAGIELDIPPMQALAGIMIVNNRTAVFGDLALALVLRSGQMEEFDEDSAAVALKQGFGRCRVKRRGSPPCRRDPARPSICCLDALEDRPRSCCVQHKFSKADAEKAALWTKAGPWTNYPGRMLQMRPRSFSFRDLFADILKGMGIAEELRDIETEAPTVAAIVSESMRPPTRKSENGSAAPAPAPAPEPLVVPDTTNSEVAMTKELPKLADANLNEGAVQVLLKSIEAIQYDKKDRKTGQLTGQKGAWYKVTAETDQTYATFSSSVADVIRTCISQKTPVVITWKRLKDKPHLSLEKLDPVMQSAAAPVGEEPPIDEPGMNG